MTLSAFSNEGIANNRPYIDPSRCRSSLSFGNLRKLSRPCVTDTWSARFAPRGSVTKAAAHRRVRKVPLSHSLRQKAPTRSPRRTRGNAAHWSSRRRWNLCDRGTPYGVTHTHFAIVSRSALGLRSNDARAFGV